MLMTWISFQGCKVYNLIFLSNILLAVAAGAPGQPNLDNITPNTAELSWTKPSKDGGGKLQGYVVEKKKKGGDWEPATEVPATSTHAKVNDLVEGEEYQFRVRALNEAGPGEPSKPTNPIKAEYQPGIVL